MVLSMATGVARAQQRLLERSYDKTGSTRLEIDAVFTPLATRGFLPVHTWLITNSTLASAYW